ncbi:hypothetical protein [Streptomyces hygroscopicus]|uniref:hypothetical protein n=1 Tax=Streptomyces hygroscopicus TaxID=1912 RepID=UPI00223F2083|nr:hypothetical protein [Streptomyces hygroscopicus]
MRIHRKRRRIGAGRWRTETVCAVTDLVAHQATPAEIAVWVRGHRIIGNILHWTKDVTFAEDVSQVRRHRAPTVMTALRDLARATFHQAGRANNVGAQRAHGQPEVVSTPTLRTWSKPFSSRQPPQRRRG